MPRKFERYSLKSSYGDETCMATEDSAQEMCVEPHDSSILEAIEQAIFKCLRFVLLSIDPLQARTFASYFVHLCERLPILLPLAQAFQANHELHKLLSPALATAAATAGNMSNSKSIPPSTTSNARSSNSHWIWTLFGRTPVTSPECEEIHALDSIEMINDVGWAVQYMQKESQVPREVSRQMKRMMHSDIPLNLFRVQVEYQNCDDVVLLGSISPESFPPTPIARQFQNKRMEIYTIAVLDHAKKALQQKSATINRTKKKKT